MTEIESRCGLLCTGCPWRESHGCRGCVESLGHPFHGECPVAQCCQARGHAHCGECDELPCGKLYAYSFADPVHGDHPPGARVAQVRRWAAERGTHAWRNVLLTSAGWEDDAGNRRANIAGRFLRMLPGSPADARVLFVTAAAINDDARAMVPVCRQQLIGIGIQPKNIVDCDLSAPVSLDDAMGYDVVYFTGGDTAHLLRRVRATGFDRVVKAMVFAGKVYVGVSAGSLIATPNIGQLEDTDTAGLALVPALLSVHCPADAKPRGDLPLPHLPLTDRQALAVAWDGWELLED